MFNRFLQRLSNNGVLGAILRDYGRGPGHGGIERTGFDIGIARILRGNGVLAVATAFDVARGPRPADEQHYA